MKKSLFEIQVSMRVNIGRSREARLASAFAKPMARQVRGRGTQDDIVMHTLFQSTLYLATSRSPPSAQAGQCTSRAVSPAYPRPRQRGALQGWPALGLMSLIPRRDLKFESDRVLL